MRPVYYGALLAAFALAACKKDADDEAATAERIVTGAKTAIVAESPFAETIEASGVVTGRADRVATLSAPGAARIAAVHAIVGQQVSAGDVLVELDQVAFRGAVSAADAALAAADKQHARQVRLAEAGIAPRRDVETAAAELAAARAAAESAHRQADLATVRSPIAGVVTLVSAIMGATADPAQPLVQVADSRVLDVVFNVPSAQAARIRSGAAVTLRADEKGDAALGEATVRAVGSAVDSATRAVAVRAEVRRSNRPMHIGETVGVQVALAVHPRAIVVPLDALVPDGETFKVFVVDASGIAHARPVEVGGRSDATAEIIKGLAAGERIVTYGAYGMDDSVKVAPAAKDAEKPAARAVPNNK